MVAAFAAASLAGCGEDGRPRPGPADVRAAQRAAAQPLYWAGRTVDGRPLTAISRSEGRVSFLYGTCEPSGDSGCGAPVSIQTTSICDRNALTVDGPPLSSRRVRGVVARVDAEGTVEVAAGTSSVTVFTNGARADRVLTALRPVEGALRGSRLPQPRYPREYVLELRRVRDAYRRTGSVRAVRGELGISQRAVRYRLRPARELGSGRLRRPLAEFKGRPCAVEPARSG
ncbi:MAG TPA: hypothetical protein VMY78_15705 [Solirubrobacteraceae bacterium]|nr:hypothetical protein [Solirubrobacteraceae bacterium]